MEEKDRIKVQIDELKVARGKDVDTIAALVKECGGIRDQILDLQEELEENKEQIETLTGTIDANEDDLKRLEEMLDELEEERKEGRNEMWRERLRELRKICLNNNCNYSKATELINEVWNDVAKMEYDLEVYKNSESVKQKDK